MTNPLPVIGTWLILVFVGLGAGCSQSGPEYKGKDITGVMPSLAFDLVDEQGNDVDASRWQGQTRLLFFGFVSCPDVCPTTLSRLGRALKALPEKERKNTTVLFVSVDPKRDTPEKLKAYTASFSPSIVGLTGKEPVLRDLAKRYRTTFSYGEKDENGNYNVSHSSAIFVFDGKGDSRLLLRGSLGAKEIAHDLKALAES